MWDNRVARNEPVVLMLTDVRRAHLDSAAQRRKVFVEASCRSLHGQGQSGTFAQEHVWLPRRWGEWARCAKS